jgi:Fe-S oxidoreductase
MFAIENEVRSMLGQEPTHSETVAVEDFGAKDVFDLDQRVLLSAMTCTECVRCTQLCPANQTGKVLSPRKIVMDVRDRMEDISTMSAKISVERVNSKLQFDDGKSLFDKISAEELYACTSCNACVEACPVLIDPLEIILQMRRYDILVNSSGPAEWLPMFNSLENNQSVWSLSASRTEWLNENI